MTKQELHSIRSLRDEIKFWERALERKRSTA
nr:MAG TPA: ATP-dependent DNA helicase [Caudoviricetes sp.]